jgi:prepilin-type N-terminal cleavage/methylation domain-containing protein
MQKKAFTMIELVITIVIVGIVSLSFPLILTQTSTNINLAMQQEAVLAAKTYIGTILSYSWDENSIMGGGSAVILDTSTSASADNEFNRVVGTNLRAGNVYGTGRRRMVDAVAATHPSNSDNANPIDIDDFSGDVSQLVVNQADMDYTFSLQLTPTISFVDDEADYDRDDVDFTFRTGAAADSTNIRLIAVRVENVGGGGTTDITLRAYSANIGEFELLSKNRGEW